MENITDALDAIKEINERTVGFYRVEEPHFKPSVPSMAYDYYYGSYPYIENKRIPRTDDEIKEFRKQYDKEQKKTPGYKVPNVNELYYKHNPHWHSKVPRLRLADLKEIKRIMRLFPHDFVVRISKKEGCKGNKKEYELSFYYVDVNNAAEKTTRLIFRFLSSHCVDWEVSPILSMVKSLQKKTKRQAEFFELVA